MHVYAHACRTNSAILEATEDTPGVLAIAAILAYIVSAEVHHVAVG